jgi:Mg2+/citrate symporter
VMAIPIPASGTVGKFFRSLMFPGVAGAVLVVGGAFFELLRVNPALGVDLLRSWGPAFILGLIALVMVAAFMGQIVDAQQANVEAQQRNADANQQVAVALTRVAEKDDRERDRMVTEVSYVMQKMEQTHAKVALAIETLNRIEAKMAAKDSGG